METEGRRSEAAAASGRLAPPESGRGSEDPRTVESPCALSATKFVESRHGRPRRPTRPLRGTERPEPLAPGSRSCPQRAPGPQTAAPRGS